MVCGKIKPSLNLAHGETSVGKEEICKKADF